MRRREQPLPALPDFLEHPTFADWDRLEDAGAPLEGATPLDGRIGAAQWRWQRAVIAELHARDEHRDFYTEVHPMLHAGRLRIRETALDERTPR